MTAAPLKHVTIIGVGLLGGSIGLALKARHKGLHIAGVGRRKASLREALGVGAIDSAFLDAAEPVGASDLVILATPVGAFQRHLEAIAGRLKGGAIVTDVGSTKAAVVRQAEGILGRGGPFIGSHPMAGSENKGAAHASAALLSGATCIVTPTPHAPPRLVGRLEAIWQGLGMRTVRMTPARHDRAVARISHLPHVVSGLLMRLAHADDLRIIGPGFRDMTRLAGGDVEMWRDIFLTNRPAVLAAIDALDESLMRFRDMVDAADAKGLERALAAARRKRGRLATR